MQRWLERRDFHIPTPDATASDLALIVLSGISFGSLNHDGTSPN